MQTATKTNAQEGLSSSSGKESKCKMTKMSSDALFKKILKGSFTEQECYAVASIMEKRFPTPAAMQFQNQ